jgi:hypothetical protein
MNVSDLSETATYSIGGQQFFFKNFLLIVKNVSDNKLFDL